MSEPKPPLDRTRDRLIGRVLVSLVSLTVMSVGVVAVATKHYEAVSSKHRSTPVSLDGASAVWMGVSLICFGLFPLAVWMRTPRQVIAWSLIWIAAAFVAFFTTLNGK